MKEIPLENEAVCVGINNIATGELSFGASGEVITGKGFALCNPEVYGDICLKR